MFSNRYIFIYTAVMVAAVAVLLALASTLLRPMQQRNEETATMQELLKAAGKKVADIKSIDLYIKPEEGAVYYVVNGTDTGSVAY